MSAPRLPVGPPSPARPCSKCKASPRAEGQSWCRICLRTAGRNRARAEVAARRATNEPLVLRVATDTDAPFFLKLRNDPETVAMSPTGAVSAGEHDRWWNATPAADYRWVAWEGPRRVGTLRLHESGTISIVVAPKARGRGVGAQMLALVRPLAGMLGCTHLQAVICWEHTASQRLFARAGYRPVQMVYRLRDTGPHPR